MAADALLKKYFVFLVLAFIALMSYVQASCATTLIGAAIGANEHLLATAPKHPIESGTLEDSPSETQKSANPILSRNPFDSVTGPLEPIPLDSSRLSTKRVDVSNPLAAPICDGMRASIITQSPDPAWSMASLWAQGDTAAKIRRVGDKIGTNEVAYIGFNPVEASPSVWVTQRGGMCQALLFRSMPAIASAPSPAHSAPTILRRGIQKVSDTEFNIDRALVDKVFEDHVELMQTVRVSRERKEGKLVGIRLFGIRPDTLLGALWSVRVARSTRPLAGAELAQMM